MLIFDTSPIIGILEQSEFAEFIDRILKLDDRLVVPDCILRELKEARDILEDYLHDQRITLVKIGSEDYEKFKKRHQDYVQKGLEEDTGEFCAMTAYERFAKDGSDVRCVIDDGPAAHTARSFNITAVGLWDILVELRDNGIIDAAQYHLIVDTLRFNGFRLPVQRRSGPLYHAISMVAIKNRLDRMRTGISDLDPIKDLPAIENIILNCRSRIWNKMIGTSLHDVPESFTTWRIDNSDLAASRDKSLRRLEAQFDLMIDGCPEPLKSMIRTQILPLISEFYDNTIYAKRHLLIREYRR
ncbi:MAG: hypothetical protein MPJ05_08385 [Nitrosopumilus sp.]|nr:hypothetical protein [Nitrosopumilus sp.]